VKEIKKKDKVYVKREIIYGEGKTRYKEGVVEGIYSNHIVVRFLNKNGSSYKESFYKDEVYKKEELSKDAYLY